MDPIKSAAPNTGQTGLAPPAEAAQNAVEAHPSGPARTLTSLMLSNHAVNALNAKEMQGSEQEKTLSEFAKEAIDSRQLQRSPNQSPNGIVQFGMRRNQATVVIQAKLNDRSEYDILGVGLKKDSGELISMRLSVSSNDREIKPPKRTLPEETNASETIKRQKVEQANKPAAKQEELKEIAEDVYNYEFRLYHGTCRESKSEIKNFGLNRERKKEGATALTKIYVPQAELEELIGESGKNLYTDSINFNYGTKSKDTAKGYANIQENPALVRFAVPDSVFVEEDPHGDGADFWNSDHRMGDIDKGYIFSSKNNSENRDIGPLHNLWHQRLNKELDEHGYAPVPKPVSGAVFSDVQSDSESDDFPESSKSSDSPRHS